MAYAVTSKASRARVSRWALSFFLCTIISLVLCLAIRAYASTSAPGVLFTQVVWIGWFAVYVSVFVCFAVSLSLTLRLV